MVLVYTVIVSTDTIHLHVPNTFIYHTCAYLRRGKFEQILRDIKQNAWYLHNPKLQNYMETEWLNCRPVSVYKAAILPNNYYIIIIQFLYLSFGAITTGKCTMQGLILTTLLRLSTMLFVADTYECVMTQQYTPL